MLFRSGTDASSANSGELDDYRYFMRRGTQSLDCDNTYPILCAQVEHAVSAPDPTIAANAHLIFLTASQPAEATVAAWDTHCNDDFQAEFGNATGRSFSALLATSARTGADIVSGLDQQWVNINDHLIARNFAELVSGLWLRPVDYSVSGGDVGWRNTFTGLGDDLNTVSGNCADWASTSSGDSARPGISYRSGYAALNNINSNCGAARQVYCVETTAP